MPVRVHELAKELNLTSRQVLERIAALGLYAKSPSSTISASDAKYIRETIGQPLPDARSGPAAPPKISSWKAGAIPPSQHPDTASNFAKISRRYSVANEHKEILGKLGSQFLYSSFCKVSGHEDCAFALVRFSGAIESAFGFTREVLFFYSPYKDLQIRTLKAAKNTVANLSREVTPDIVFFYAPDPRLREKLDDWSSGGFLAIPLVVPDDGDPIKFISLLRDYIFARDLFYETTPVSGDRFFGRRKLLQSLRDDIRNQRVSGLFGLRKSGKTSVLSELRESQNSAQTIMVLRDLESLPSPPLDPVPQLLKELVGSLLDELRARNLRTQELATLPAEANLSDFKTGFQTLLRKLMQQDIKIVLMLDEIEYLTPADRVDVEEGPLDSVSQFLGVLRSLVQESPNFTFMVSGLTSAIIESGRLYGRPNPLFSWAKANFLSPFERHEADELALTTGQKMGIVIDRGALEALYEASGGHAFLYRHLASKVVSTLPVDVYQREIKKPDVLRATDSWRLQVAGNMREMLDHLKRYYPDESYLLEILRDEPNEFVGIADSAPSALSHLIGLGLVVWDQNEYELTPVLHLL